MASAAPKRGAKRAAPAGSGSQGRPLALRPRTAAPQLTPEQTAARKAREQAARAMVGLRVLISKRVQRLKQGVPSGPLEIRDVTRRDERLGVTLSGRDARGEHVTYKDWFHMDEDLTQRYLRTDQDDAPTFQAENYTAFFKSSVAAGRRAQEEVYGLQAEPLEKVMPLFQFEHPNIKGTTIRRLGNGGVADLQALLASDCRPFHGEAAQGATTSIWRASTGEGRHFDTQDDALREQVCSLLHVRYTRDDVVCGRCKVPSELGTVGGTPLHPWQVWMYAEFQSMLRDQGKGTAESILVARQRGGYGCVQGMTKRPENINVYVAEPGEGKTRLGALCALDLPTMVVACRGTVRHWQREAGMVGVAAFQVGSGGKTPTEAQALLAREPRHTWIVTREVLSRLVKKGSLGTLPEPRLIVVDEFHMPLLCLKELFSAWPGAVCLGLSGTFHRDKVASVAREIGWDQDVLEAAVVRVPRHALKGVFPNVEVRVKRVDMTKLEFAAYAGGKRWMNEQERQRILIFSPPEQRDAQYGADLWTTIVKQLQDAEQEVHRRLARLLNHVLAPERKQAVLEQFAEELGPDAASRIHDAAAELPDVVTSYGPAEVRAHTAAAFARRKAILDSYPFVVRQLDAVSAASEIDCPVCMDKTKEWSISRCGHLVCTECSQVRELHGRCPTCRTRDPSWKSAADIALLRNPAAPRPAAPDDGFGAASGLDTSSKLKGLASILLQLSASERALVVCPGQLLRAVASEMERVGVRLGIMAGPGAEQERTLAAWSRGNKRYQGLLCPPTILGVDLPDATTIIFLTDVIPEDDYKQALARVVRQGNSTVDLGQAVKVWFVVCRQTEEEDAENLRAKIDIAKQSSGLQRGEALSSSAAGAQQ